MRIDGDFFRKGGGADPLEDVNAAPVGHADFEHGQVGLCFAEHGTGVPHGAGNARDIHVLNVLERLG